MQEVPWERSRKRLVLKQVHVCRTVSLIDSRTEKRLPMDIFILTWFCLKFIWYEFILLWFLTITL